MVIELLIETNLQGERQSSPSTILPPSGPAPIRRLLPQTLKHDHPRGTGLDLKVDSVLQRRHTFNVLVLPIHGPRVQRLLLPPALNDRRLISVPKFFVFRFTLVG